jgi:hypothetical protein
MFRKDPNDILTQLDNYINQVWSSDGYSLSKANQRAHTDMMTYVFLFFYTLVFLHLLFVASHTSLSTPAHKVVVCRERTI